MPLPDLFTHVYNTNYQKVYDFAHKLTDNKHRAQDITQQCFLKLWEKAADLLHEEEDIFPLLYVIVKRIVIDESRRRSLEKVALKDWQNNAPQASNNAENHLLHRSARNRVAAILKSMPEKRRYIYMLYKEEGISHQEIAQRLNISITTVRSHLKEAMQTMRKTLGGSIPIVVCILAASACHKTDPLPNTPTGPVTQQEINQWILDSMQTYYYWNNTLPTTASNQLTPLQWFAQLKNSADRFSYVYLPSDKTTYPASLRNTFGMEAAVITWPAAAGGVLGIVQLVQPGSPAYSKGFQRGQLFTAINGTLLTKDNATSMLTTLATNGQGSLSLNTLNSSGTLQPDTTLPITKGGAGDEPAIEASTTWTINGIRTGYCNFNYFDDTQSQSVIDLFSTFKQQQVSQLILDLRFSPGGSVAVCALLCALIGHNITAATPFIRYNGNAQLGTRNLTFAQALALPEKGTAVTFNQLSGAQLSLPKIYILTSTHTASAAELTINNLKPYTQIIQIGTTTLGKDEGMVTITDRRSPQRIPWVILPITFKLQNAQGTGNYSNGLTPDYTVDELASLPLKPIGDTTDPLIARAHQLISGNGRINIHPTPTPVRRFSTPTLSWPIHLPLQQPQ